MSTIRIRLQGELGEITLSALGDALHHMLKIIGDLDYALSRKRGGEKEWVVTDLSPGSLCVAVKRRTDDGRIGARVSDQWVNGLRRIEREGATPPYLSHDGMKETRALLKIIGNKGVSGIVVGSDRDEEELSAKASANVDQLLPEAYTSVGSVEGHLDAISLHGGRPKYVVYHDRTHRAINCAFPRSLLPAVKDALGQRVNVYGIIHWNPKGEQLRVEDGDLRILGPDSAIPRIEDISGSDPDLLGRVSAAEYLGEARGGQG
jgi:hypothetical protein